MGIPADLVWRIEQTELHAPRWPVRAAMAVLHRLAVAGDWVLRRGLPARRDLGPGTNVPRSDAKTLHTYDEVVSSETVGRSIGLGSEA
jgi:hypothetical protein